MSGKNTNLDLPVSPLILPLIQTVKQLVIFEGSTRSGKTWQIIFNFIAEGFRPFGQFSPNLNGVKNGPVVMRAFRKTRDDCRNTVAKEFVKIMKKYCRGLWDDRRWSNWTYHFPDGSEYHFAGCDPDRLPGYTQDLAHLEEVMEIDYDSAQQIMPRTSGRVILSFNPTLTQHWVFTKIMEGYNPDMYCYIHSTYKDNLENLTERQIYDIEKWEPTAENIKRNTADPWRWEVYGKGKRSKREGAVFENWDIVDSFPDKMACERWGYGLDFGFTIDPSVLVECALFQDEIYVREIFYERKLTTLQSPSNDNYNSIQKMLYKNNISRTDKIICDNNKPEAIEELRRAGYNTVAVKKARGSIDTGLDKLKTYFIHIARSSQKTQAEFENYIHGKIEGTYEGPDHAIDAIRYWGSRHLTGHVDFDNDEQGHILDFSTPAYGRSSWPSEWNNARVG